jgi:hypothetical protein
MSACMALICGFVASSPAQAEVYSWTDENGVTHFSETPPPDGREAQVEDIPDAVPGYVEDESGVDPDSVFEDPASPGSAGTEDTMSAADLKRQELAERRTERQEEQKAIESACRQAEARLAQIEPARRVFYTNEEGETVRMDDEERVDEVDQLHDFIDENCSN